MLSRLPWLCVLALFAGCAALGGGRTDDELRADLERAERALESRDAVAAREAVDAVLGESPSGELRGDAERLERAVRELEIEPFQPLFDELSAALERRDEPLARRLLARAFALQPRGAARERAESFRAVVEGRSTSSGVALALETLPAEAADEYRVFLTAHHELGETVHLRLPGSALDFTCIGVLPSGIENRSKRRVMSDALENLQIESGVRARVPLATFSVRCGGMMAVQARWELAARDGILVLGSRELPAKDLAASGCALVRLDPRLPASPVDPVEFTRYVERGAPSLAALLERAVRVEPARRRETLDLASARLRALPDAELERLAPALRWLADLSEPPVGGEAWRTWLEARARAAAEAPRPALDLPVR